MSYKFNTRKILDHLDDEDFLDELEVKEKIRRKPKKVVEEEVREEEND